MSLRKKIVLGFVFFFTAIFLLLVVAHLRMKATVANYKKELIAQGEKLTIAELTPLPPTNGPNGGPDLVAAAASFSGKWEYLPSIMTAIKPGRARVSWTQPELFDLSEKSKTNLWPLLQKELESNEDSLNEMRSVLQRPVIYFPLDFSQGYDLLFPHLIHLKRAEQWLSASAIFHLYRRDFESAYEDLIASVSLPQLYQNEPLIISQLVRAAMVHIAFNATWEALQSDGFTDEQWKALQNCWQGMEFFNELESSLAMERVMYGEKLFNDVRKSYTAISGLSGPSSNPFSEVIEMGKEALADPGHSFKEFVYRYPGYWSWQWFWSYNEERFFFQERQRGIEAVRLVKKEKSFAQALKTLEQSEKQNEVNPEELNPRYFIRNLGHFSQHTYLFGIAKISVMREMAVAGIALKRFHLRHQKYPAQLSKLIPDYVETLPIDYFDGQPLRYRLRDDGTFLLYSIGENGRDDNGDPTPKEEKLRGFQNGIDWVWPSPATEEEIEAFAAEKLNK